jgi:D-serine deaminase-like pyridoxal phosphate-dependent protein
MQNSADRKSSHPNLIGRNIAEIPTPALVVDLPILMENIAVMQEMVSSHGMVLRPHIKTHKCSTVAKMQIAAGSIGVTCATVGEAEAMAIAGIRDILIANQVVTQDKLLRVARLQEISETKFAVDSVEGIEIAKIVAREQGCTFEVLVEVDSGGNRCGAQTPQEAVALVNRILESGSLRFGGIQAYYGGTSYIKTLEERERAVKGSDQLLSGMLEAVQQVCEIPRVSGAGTGNALYHLKNGLLTEIQSGSYVYSDTTYRELAPEYQSSLFVLSTIISHPVKSRVILDAGLKSMGTEFSSPQVVGYPNFKDHRYSEEHFQWRVDDPPFPGIGEKVKIIPSHCCTTVNLHRRCFAIRNKIIEDIWEIDAF